ncbi:MAG TPA: ribonuclease III [Candidatus Scatomonas merdigallinarum]|nr:ribonuclease III [Candidatus Scatomonas merdigallinarum]
MEKSVEYLKQLFDLPEVKVKQYSPLTLAYIGDAAYELVVRTVLVSRANTQVNKLHHAASNLVKAETQSRMIDVLEPHFTPEEEHIYKRGRNAKSYTSAKNASITDYRRATGFEAVMGYLYLKGEFTRMLDLIKLGIAPEEAQE